MPIPKTREDLLDLVTTSFEKLERALEDAGPAAAGVRCVENWSVKDLLAVRAWWTASVVEWIEAGRKGRTFDLPARGYAWKDTPRLNDDIVRRARGDSYRQVRSRLKRGYRRVLETIDGLEDEELLDAGVFEWTGKWPVARWISINTARQYTTARTFVRRAARRTGN